MTKKDMQVYEIFPIYQSELDSGYPYEQQKQKRDFKYNLF